MIIFSWHTVGKIFYFTSNRQAILAFEQASDEGLQPVWDPPMEVTELLRKKDQLIAQLLNEEEQLA